MEYPKYAKIDGKKYKINTDFRVAIECNEIAQNKGIGEYEKALAIIYKLFGDEGLEDFKNHEKLIEIAYKYLCCGKTPEPGRESQEPDMDYIEDEGYIRSSFQFDYKYDPYEMEYCHWYKFFNDLNNLSNNDIGTCCILNRVRNIRNYDLKKIKDPKERNKMQKAKEMVQLKRYKKEAQLTKEQMESMEKLNEILGI